MQQRIPVWALAMVAMGPGAWAQGEFLTPGEIDRVRDAQEPDKRIVLYLDFAQARLDSVRAALSAQRAGAGRSAQRALSEYVRILEAMEGTIRDAREQRVVLKKGLEAVKERAPEFLKYLESLNVPTAPGWADYRFTAEDAVEITREQIEEAGKGAFPEVEERTPPTDLPARPPRR